MSFLSSINNPTKPKLLKASCFALAILTAYSSSATGITAIFKLSVEQSRQHFENLQRRPSGSFTERPTKVFYGARPSRDPMTRGGWWTPNLLKDLKRMRQTEQWEAPIAPENLYLSMIPTALPMSVTEGDSGGGENPGEGTGEGGGSQGGGGTSQLNTNTGNRHVSYPIVNWTARGESGVNLTLHHNSFGAYTFDLGKGWSHGYDIKITHSPNSSAIVRYGNGSIHPYTEEIGTFTPPAGVHDQLVHHANGTWTITSKNRSKLEFNSAGRLTAVKDKNNNTISINRDANQKIFSISDGTGRALTFTHTNGLISQITDPSGRVWAFDYDANNNLTGITYPELNSDLHTRNFTYDGLSNILTETDLRGKVWSFSYDTLERLAAFTNPLNNQWTWTYSASAATMTQPNGKTVVHNYSNGLVASKVDQAGFSAAYLYDTDRNVTSFTDKRGKVWTSTYDSKGNRLTKTNPLGKTSSYSYSTNNDILSVTNPLGNTSSFNYDANGNRLTATDPLSRTTETLTYNAFGELTTSTDAMGRQSAFSYDPQGDLVQTTDPSNVSSWITYDLMGRALTVTDGASNVYAVEYDDWDRVIEFTEPGAVVSTIQYDLEDAIVSATDPLGRSGTRILDDLGRTVSAVNAKGESTTYAYNSVGYVTSITNGRAYTRTYTYTDRGQVATLTLADGAVEQWAYNGNGETTAYVNPLGQTINYLFDDAGRTTTIDYPTGLTDTTFNYDNAGRQTAMVDATGTSAWTYNAASEITALSTPQGNINYTYNLAGQISTTVDVGVGTTTYTYDTAGRPSTVTDPFGDVSTCVYDTAGRLSRKNNPNGTYELYAYDSRNRVTSITTKNSANSVLQSRTYSFDLASQVTQVIEGGITTNYGYDNIGQLTSETKSTGYSASYTYDANGNRLTRSLNGSTENYSYDPGDKLTAITGGSDPRTYGYDAAGRTTTISRSSGTTTFTYDFESRITSISKPGTTTNTFTYNGLDTRVAMTDSSGSKTFKRDGVYVTDSVLSDGTATFTPSGEVRAGTKTTFHSGLKNDDIQTSSTGTTTASKLFDAFGNQIAATGTWNSPFAYAGKFGYQQDPDSNLKLLGHRYYDPSTGRFLTRDPIKDGRNWYSYAYNDPARRADPDGTVAPVVYLIYIGIAMILGTGAAMAPSEPGQDYDRQRFVLEKLEMIWELATVLVGGPVAKGAKAGARYADDAVEYAVKSNRGRRGGVAHRKAVANAEDDFQAAGYKLISGGSREEKIRGLRYPDLLFSKDGKIIAVQVGRKNKNGAPVAREVDAAGDLIDHGSIDEVWFVPYD